MLERLREDTFFFRKKILFRVPWPPLWLYIYCIYIKTSETTQTAILYSIDTTSHNLYGVCGVTHAHMRLVYMRVCCV